MMPLHENCNLFPHIWKCPIIHWELTSVIWEDWAIVWPSQKKVSELSDFLTSTLSFFPSSIFIFYLSSYIKVFFFVDRIICGYLCWIYRSMNFQVEKTWWLFSIRIIFQMDPSWQKLCTAWNPLLWSSHGADFGYVLVNLGCHNKIP